MSLITRDLQHIWHPCSQMSDYEDFPPIVINSARGEYLIDQHGNKIIDAIASWWCKSLGHNHPKLKQALSAQMDKFEHVILANTTNQTIVELSEKLCALTNLDKAFYASEGSSCVEIALKMSIHARVIKKEHKRKKFIALGNGYHGETLGALSVSDLGLYKAPYKDLMFDTHFIKNVPYVNSTDDPLWHDSSSVWQMLLPELEALKDTATAIIVEPILQAAGGMLLYSKDFLKRLCEWAQHNNIHFIVDEIMTGIGRTGKYLAYEHADIQPDIVCISKGLTSGWLPLSVALTSNEMFNLFYDDYDTGKAFLHSHTYCGNALAVSVALATLKVFTEEKILEKVAANHKIFVECFTHIASQTQRLTNIRAIGGMIAADLITKKPRASFAVFQEAVKLGALLRPLGNTIYWCPPLNISEDAIYKLRDITILAIQKVFC